MEVYVKHIAILDDYQQVALSSADWTQVAEAAEIDTFQRHFDDEQELVSAIDQYEIVVAMRERTPFPRSVLERLPRLELLVTTGPVNTVIDLEAASSLGIRVCATRGYLGPAMEHTWALILACAKQVPALDRGVKAGKWQTTMGIDLRGSRLGVIGLGRYGAEVANVATAFGMDVVAWSPNLTVDRCESVGVSLVTKRELLLTSDVVTVHLVLSERSRRTLGAADLALMKPTAYLINTSRGPLVDEPALVEALRRRTIAGAGLDVFDVEPLPADHPLLSLDNVVLTPHMGYVSPGSYAVYFGDAVEDILAHLNSQPIRELIASEGAGPESSSQWYSLRSDR
jgi:phosphoglycerate dehydrogenase-like enzyme